MTPGSVDDGHEILEEPVEPVESDAATGDRSDAGPAGPWMFGDRLTLEVPEAGKLLGLRRTAAYDAVRRGQIPSIRLGRRVLVPVPALMRLLEQ